MSATSSHLFRILQQQQRFRNTLATTTRIRSLSSFSKRTTRVFAASNPLYRHHSPLLLSFFPLKLEQPSATAQRRDFGSERTQVKMQRKRRPKRRVAAAKKKSVAITNNKVVDKEAESVPKYKKKAHQEFKQRRWPRKLAEASSHGTTVAVDAESTAATATAMPVETPIPTSARVSEMIEAMISTKRDGAIADTKPSATEPSTPSTREDEPSKASIREDEPTTDLTTTTTTQSSSSSSQLPTTDDGVAVLERFQNPTYALNIIYESKGIVPKSCRHFMTTSMHTIGKEQYVYHYWTATLECPLTQQCFFSGRLRASNTTNDDDSSEKEYVMLDDNKNKNGQPIVAYAKKSMAQDAAAARALDWIRFDENGQLEPRWCEEDPLAALSTVKAEEEESGEDEEEQEIEEMEYEEEELEQQDISHTNQETKNKKKRKKKKNDFLEETSTGSSEAKTHGSEQKDETDAYFETMKKETAESNSDADEEEGFDVDTVSDNLHGIDTDIVSSSFTEDTASIDSDEDEDLLMMQTVEEEDEDIEDSANTATNATVRSDEDEYVIYTPPGKRRLSAGARGTPAQLLLQSLAEQIPTNLERPIARVGRIVNDPVSEAKRTMAWAREWVEAEKRLRQQNSHDQTDIDFNRIVLKTPSEERLLVQAKSILRCLSEAIDGIPLGTRITGTQKVAFNILDLLWNSDAAKPDADIYALYLKCLDGPDGPAIAAKADAIVKNMFQQKHSQGHVPPPPIPSTFNTLLELHGQAGFPRQTYEHLLSRFEPDAKTSWVLLSSVASKQSNDEISFDTEFCQQCVKKIQEFSGDNELSFSDLQLLNAPLRWAGGRKWNNRRLPWPMYSVLYRKGFRNYDESNSTVQRAKGIQEWVDNNPCLPSVKPDVASYEAVIQAWVRTRTRKGLEHAEEVATKLLSYSPDSPKYPRFMTFHPILCAWLHCDDPEKGHRLKQWTDRILEEASVSKKIAADARLYELAIYSRLFLLEQQVSGESEAMDDSERVALAKECSVLLDRFCRDTLTSYTDPEGPIFLSLWRPFVFTMNAWQNCVQACAKGSGERDPIVLDSDGYVWETAVGELRDSRMKFEWIVSAFSEIDSSSPRIPGLLSQTMEEIVGSSFQVYCTFAGALEGISKLDNRGSLPRQFPSILVDIEGCTRKMGEFNLLSTRNYYAKESEGLPQSSDGTKVYADHFDYGFDLIKTNHVAMKRTTFPWNAVSLLYHMADSSSVASGDLVRQCHLLNELTRSWNFKSSKFEEQTAKVLDRALPSSQHHSSLMDSVRQMADTKDAASPKTAEEHELYIDASTSTKDKGPPRAPARRQSKTKKSRTSGKRKK